MSIDDYANFFLNIEWRARDTECNMHAMECAIFLSFLWALPRHQMVLITMKDARRFADALRSDTTAHPAECTRERDIYAKNVFGPE